jgi:hypothetical protein
LLKRGTAISSKDLKLAKYFEKIAIDPKITQIDPNQQLQLDLIDNQITASYPDLDGTRFSFDELTPHEIISWGILTASELELHLEAEKLEQDLLNEYLEANPGTGKGKAYFDLQPQLQAIRAKYPRVSPQEARKRYTQVFSSYIREIYQSHPEQPITALDTWLTSNYTQEHDYQELLGEHYPEQPQGLTWNYQAGLNAYLEAINQGLTWDNLAKAMDSYRGRLGDTWAKHPNTWINEQIDLHSQAKARPASRAGEATNLGDILASFTRA